MATRKEIDKAVEVLKRELESPEFAKALDEVVELALGKPVTQLNVVLDTVAALDMYEGDFGDDDVQIEEVIAAADADSDIIVTLTNGQTVRLRVENIQ